MKNNPSVDKLRIVCASWLVSMTGPAIKNGAVVLQEGRVKEVGELAVLASHYPDISLEHFSGVFIPGFINAHMHLELSHLPASSPLAHDKNFTDWVENLLEKRFATTLTQEEHENIVLAHIQEQHDSGVVFIGDVGNSSLSTPLVEKAKELPELYKMLELLGSSVEATHESIDRMSNLSDESIVAAHAPYSTRPELLAKIKDRCDTLGHIFSIHTAEVEDETEFIASHSGLFKEFLVKRGVWKGDFFEQGPQANTTIEYFNRLGLLNERTLLVHCVHISKSDIELVKKSGANICICPGSNNFLHSGKAPVAAMLAGGVLPTIGTDSISSNLELDMWGEIKRIKDEHPEIQPYEILKMATVAGARAFHREQDFGEISAGKKAAFLHVSSSEIKNCITETELLNMLISNGRPEQIEWIHQSFINPTSN